MIKIKSVLECKDINELIKRCWSYPIRGAISSGKGLYCWKKYILLGDDNKEFVNFVVSDNKTEYPDNGVLDGYYYETVSQEEVAQLMADTEAGSFLVSDIKSVQRVDADTISLQISY